MSLTRLQRIQEEEKATKKKKQTKSKSCSSITKYYYWDANERKLRQEVRNP